MKLNSTQPAFPNITDLYIAGSGLTKREYYIGVATQSVKEPFTYVGEKDTENSYREYAKKCINLADIILDELNKI